MVSKGHNSKYESFKDEIDEDYENHTASISNPLEPSGATLYSDIELVGNGIAGNHSTPHSTMTNHIPSSSLPSPSPQQPKRVRLRAVESEREYFLKQMNVDLFRKLALVQAIASLVIVISQIVLYAIVTTVSYKVMDNVGIGLWGPMIFFSTACWLTWINTKSPSGCSIGTAMGFQICSFIVGLVLLIFAVFSLTQHGQYSYWHRNGSEYDPETTGRVFCSFIILATVCEAVAAIIISIQYCRVTCCARSNAHETIVFDVETVKV